MKTYKKVYLYKLGRFQEDFEYLFPNIKIKNYIVDDNKRVYNKKTCIKLNKLKKDKTLIVICDRKNEKTTKKLNKLGFIENKNYMYLEDFGTILDKPIQKKSAETINKFKKTYNIELGNYSIKNSQLLKKMIYTEQEHNLDCHEPFRYAQIEPNGLIYPCCPVLIDEPLGSILFDSPKNIWNSTRAKLIRLSIINKTYAFCNLEYCRLKDINEATSERDNSLIASKIPEYTVISYDQSCNLKCRSCRTCNINNNSSDKHQILNSTITKKLLNSSWLNKTKQLVMATQGEVFFSNTYKNILFSKKLKNLNTLIIHTNATLLSPKKLNKLCEHCEKQNIKCLILNVSVDSANKETYEKLRCGANFDILKKNLTGISQARKEGKFYTINMITVLQRDNYEELPDIAKFAIELGFDRLDVQLISNWGTFTNEEFKKISMMDENGRILPELQKILRDPIFKSEKIEFVGSVFKREKYMD